MKAGAAPGMLAHSSLIDVLKYTATVPSNNPIDKSLDIYFSTA
jgi:hypothetical protein